MLIVYLVKRNIPFIVHVKVTAPHCPVSRHNIFVVPDGVYPARQVCVAVALYVVIPATSRCVRPFSGFGNVSPQSTKFSSPKHNLIHMESNGELQMSKRFC